MKRAVGILSTVMAPVLAVAVASAADPMGMGTEGTGTKHYGTGSEASGTAASAASKAMGQHQMSGTITSLDKEEGTFQFRSTEGKEMELQVPPTALRDLNEGDRVTLSLGIRPASGATSGSGAGSGSRSGTGTGTGGTGGGMR